MPFVTDNNSGRMRLDLVRKRCSFFLSFLPGFHFQPAPPPVTLRLRALGLTWRGRWAAFPDQLDSVCLDQFRSHLPVIAEKCAYPDRMVLGYTPSSRLERYQLFTRQRGHFNKSLGAEEGVRGQACASSAQEAKQRPPGSGDRRCGGMRQARQCGPAQGQEGTGFTEQWVARRRAGQSHQGGVEDEIDSPAAGPPCRQCAG